MKLKSILLVSITTAFAFSALQAEAKSNRKSEGYVIAKRYFASDQEQFPRPKKVAKTKKSKKKSSKFKKNKKH